MQATGPQPLSVALLGAWASLSLFFLSLAGKFPSLKPFPFACWYAVYPEKAMALYSSTLAWKIPWTEEPGRPAVHDIAKSQT